MVNHLVGRIGLVLSGAVAQGGFEAGALITLAVRTPSILSIAGTSSGALNATVVAAGVASGRLEKAASVLKNFWIEDGSWQHIADLPTGDWLHLRGAFDTRRLQALIRDAIAEVLDGWDGRPSPVVLRLVTTNLNALPRQDGSVPLPTYEQVIAFSQKDLVDRDSWGKIANVAAASATFPGLFSPTLVDGAPCIDGGAVNNAPISYVLKEADVDTVVVVTTESPTIPLEASLGGTALIARVAAALVNERIAHDLNEARKVNERYAAIVRVLNDAGVSAEAKGRVLKATGFRPIKLYLVQPETPLPGDAFSGLLHRDQRSAYVAAGEQARMVPIGG